jgi:hypothetical protein
MVDTLDLDALLPESKKLILKGKSYEVLPLTIEQLIIFAKLEEKLKKVKVADEIKSIIFDALKPVIPELENLNFTINQLLKIVEFAQSSSLPAENKTVKDYDPKKKINSAEESPTSSASIPPTP